jgi:hypothetical protein
MKDINSFLKKSFLKDVLNKSNHIRNNINSKEINFDDNHIRVDSLFELEAWISKQNEKMNNLKEELISKSHYFNGLPNKGAIVDNFIKNSIVYNKFLSKSKSLFMTIANENIYKVNRIIDQVDKSDRSINKMDYSEYSKIGYAYYSEISNIHKDLINASDELAQKIIITNELSTSNEFVRLFDHSFSHIIKESDLLTKKIINKYKDVLESITLGFNHEEKDVNSYIGMLKLYKNDTKSLNNIISKELLKYPEYFQNNKLMENDELMKLSIKNNKKLLFTKLLGFDTNKK